MKTNLAAAVAAAMLTWPAGAQVLPAEPVAVHSQSGQFVVSGASGLPGGAARAQRPVQAPLLALEPSLLAVSCERIKQALARELGLTDPWHGRVRIGLYAADNTDAPIDLRAERFRDGWNYRLDLPNPVDRFRLMRAVVEVLLLETANRRAAGRSAEIPAWLSVGLAEHLLAASGAELLLPAPQWNVRGLVLNPVVVTARRESPLATAHARLRERGPLDWAELSWPTERDFSGDSAALYRSSAQVLVMELLRLKDGRACLRSFLEALPQHLNWQTAFLEAFRPRFARLLEVEKWWALQTVHFTGRDLSQTWPADESWHRLAEVLRAPVQVRAATNDLPRHAQVSLQTVIREYDHLLQTRLLRDRLRQLDLLRIRLAEELLPVADGYRRTLQSYLHQRDQSGPVLAGGRAARPDGRQVIRATLRQLNELDARFQALRPQAAAAPPTAAAAGSRPPP